MAGCCQGTATWECCYPDTCGCDCGACQDPGSCSNCLCFPNSDVHGNPCSGTPKCPGPCGHTPSVMTVAGCCTCNSGNWGYAWPCCNCCHGAGAGLCPSCGAYLYFTLDCFTYYQAPRVDTGPSTTRLCDFTKALFMQFAPLSQGTISNMKACPSVNNC